MQLFNTIAELQRYISQHASTAQGRKTIGLVPTMGALHQGHISLMEQARQTTDIVIVSIFVNPLQFSPTEDFDQYPRPQQSDRDLCQSAGVDALFMPSAIELYGVAKPNLSEFTQVVPPAGMTNKLCGRSRPTHFQGVATIVTKLLNIVCPTHAFFGQKDAQQVAILKRLVKDLHLPGKIVVCPIIRESDGLALSSRNRYLSPQSRKDATILYQALKAAEAAFNQGERSAIHLVQTARTVIEQVPVVKLDYLALVHPDTLEPLQTIDLQGMMAIAANLTNPDQTQTRLIDNIILQTDPEKTSPKKTSRDRQPIIAIDGPAGAGKSTVARQVAHNLGLLYLDTGAMYRALTWFVLEQGIDPAAETDVARQLANCNIQLVANPSGDQPLPPTVQVNGNDVTTAIRTPKITAQVSTIAAQAAVREHLVAQQQAYGTTAGGIVADGRDIGTKVFPDAELKIYLSASVEERANRRYRDLVAARQKSDGDLPTLEALTQSISERDRKDSTRAVSPLKKAPDAIEIVTDDLTAEQVIEKISVLYQQINSKPAQSS